MKILINASNLVMGGALQVARALLIEIPNVGGNHRIKAVVSPQLAEILPEAYDSIVVDPSPAKIIAGISSRKKLYEIEKKFSPDVVLSIFGPTYWRPKSLHVCGFANPWTYTSNKYAWKTLSYFEKIKEICIIFLKRFELQREKVNTYICETKHMSDVIQTKFPNKSTFVVGNNCGQPFYNKIQKNTDSPVIPEKGNDEYRIVTLSQYYPHKNLDLIPYVALAIKKQYPLLNFKFYLPLDVHSKGWEKIDRIAKKMNVGDTIQTVGTVSPEDAPHFYKNADLMFLPSVLECFSANYPESMTSGVPIVTTNLPFAKTVCEDAALYFEPMNAKDAASKIIQIYINRELREDLISKGYKIAKKYFSPQKKIEEYLKICEELVSSYND